MSSSNFISKIKNGWKTILFFLVVATLLAVKYNYYSPKEYQATAQIRTNEIIPDNNNNLFSKFNWNTTTSGNNLLLTNALLNNRENQNLNVEYFLVEPLFKTELYTNSPITVSHSLKSEKFYKQTFDFKYSSASTFTLHYEYNGIKRSRVCEFGKEIHETELNFTINKNSDLIPARNEDLLRKDLRFIIYSDQAIVDALSKNAIDIFSQNGTTTITATNTVPEKAMLLANTISDGLFKESHSLVNLDLINEQLTNVAAQLDAAQEAVAKYKIENAITEIPFQTDAHLKHLENLEVQKMNLRLQSLALDNLSDYLRMNRINGNAAPEYGTITDPVFAEYITTLNEKILENTTQYDNKNSKLISEITFLKNTIAEGIRNTRKTVALQTDEINKQIAVSKFHFSSLPDKENDLQTLNRNLYLVEKLYNYLADKRTEALYQSAVPTSQNNIIQKANLPSEPVNFNASTIWVLALFWGLLAGCMAAVVLSKFKKQSVSDRKIIDIKTSIPYFASIENGSKIDVSRQFENICTKLLVLKGESEKQIITVTSTNEGVGKTFVAVQLAKSLVALDLKVLLMDMNSSNPSLHGVFETNPSTTLAEIIQKQNQVQDAVQITSIPNLDIIAGGEFTNGINSLIATNKINRVLNDLKKYYDYIIVDACDTFDSMEAIPLMKMSDLSLYVVNVKSDANSIFEHIEHIKKDYQINNIHLTLNSAPSITKYLSQKHKIKLLRNKESQTTQPSNERPSFLRRVALWFY